MPPHILLRAQKRLRYNGRDVQMGTLFLTTPVEAAAFVYRHDAVFASPQDAPPTTPRPKRIYKRRDLEAES